MSVKIDLYDLQHDLKNVEAAFSSRVTKRIGEQVVDKMKDLISKGISPIEGKGRFPGYLRAGEKGRYPDRYAHLGKRARPVNLKLTGEFLASLKAEGNKAEIEIGYFEADQAVKEQGHREGVHGQPKRPTIPVGNENENFTQTIQQIIIDGVVQAVEDYLKK